MTDQGTALELLPSTLTHTQEQGLKGGYASTKNPKLACENSAKKKEEPKQFCFPFLQSNNDRTFEEVRE